MSNEIKETAAAGSVGAHAIAAAPGRFGAKPKKRDFKGFLVNYYDNVGNKLRMFPVNLFKLGLDKKVKVVSAVNENFNLDSVLAQLSSYENKTATDESEVTTYGVEDDKGNLMKVTVLNTEAEDFESYIAAYLSELKDFENQGVDLEDISLAELLYKLKDLFDIRDVEFPNIPEDIVYNADEASDSVENLDTMPNEEGMGDEGMENADLGGEDMGADLGGEDMGADLDGEFEAEGEFGDDEFGDDESVEDFDDFEDEGSTQSILTGIIDMLKAQAEAETAKAEAAAEEARADQAEYTARAAEATLATKEELIAMDAEKANQKEDEKSAKRQADLATYRYNKSRSMVDNPAAQFEGFAKDSLLMDAIINEEDIMMDDNLIRRQMRIEMKALQDALRDAQTPEEKRAIQRQLTLLPQKFNIKRKEAKAREEQDLASNSEREEEEANTDPRMRDPRMRDPRMKAQMQTAVDSMFETETETISEEEYELLNEAAKRQFKRYGNKFVRKFRCYGGPKNGKMVSSAAGCGMRKDPLKVRQGKRAARIKKGQRTRKTQLAKRKAPSKRLVRMNKILRGMKGTK